MTPEQFAEFLNYVKENNSWGEKMGETCSRNRIPYKYIEATWDARDNKVYAIKLRASGSTDGVVFLVESPQHIKKLYEYLDKPLKENKKRYRRKCSMQ